MSHFSQNIINQYLDYKTAFNCIIAQKQLIFWLVDAHPQLSHINRFYKIRSILRLKSPKYFQRLDKYRVSICKLKCVVNKFQSFNCRGFIRFCIRTRNCNTAIILPSNIYRLGTLNQNNSRCKVKIWTFFL